MKRLGIGLQLYTLRDELEKDFKGVLREVAALGYEGVEFAGYYDTAAAELKQLLDELGLKAIGSHVSVEKLRDNLQGEMDYLKTIGGKYLICPYVAPENRQKPEDWKTLFAFFAQVAAEAKKQGLQFLYHNHEFEFEMEVDGRSAFDALYASTDREEVQVELDVCWVQFSGNDPLAYIANYAGRLPLIHFKDFTKDAEGKIVTLELGLGVVQLDQVIQAAERAGAEWLIVEQDRCQKAPLTSIANSMNWVKEHYTQVHQ